MARRLHISHLPVPAREKESWLNWLKKQKDDQLTMKQMLRIQNIIERLELPCQLSLESGVTLLRIYERPTEEANPSHARPVPLLTIREMQVPRGEQPHPRLGTLGKAWLSRIVFNEPNETRCKAANINPGSLRPGSIPPKIRYP